MRPPVRSDATPRYPYGGSVASPRYPAFGGSHPGGASIATIARYVRCCSTVHHGHAAGSPSDSTGQSSDGSGTLELAATTTPLPAPLRLPLADTACATPACRVSVLIVIRMPLRAGLLTGVVVPSRSDEVPDILLLRASPQVSRVHTRRVVTHMTDNKPFRDRAVSQLVGVPVSVGAGSTYRVELPVSLLAAACLPLPAVTRPSDSDFAPKPLGNKGFHTGHSSIFPRTCLLPRR